MENDWMRSMTDSVTQVSILDALLARKFDGCLPCRELLKYGDIGIGTYDRMDGEMIVVDGCLYQARSMRPTLTTAHRSRRSVVSIRTKHGRLVIPSISKP